MPFQDRLTRRELEILHLISFSYNSREIARKFHISYNTVNTHRKNLMSKLDTKTSAGLVRRGFEYGMLKSSMQFIEQSA